MPIDKKGFSGTTAEASVTGVHLWLVLMKAYHAMAAQVSKTYRDSGLGDSDFRVLEVLLHKGALPVNTIGPKVFLTPGSISIAIERLHKKGLVSRDDSPTDRRVRVVDLTAKGRTLIRKMFDAHARCIEETAEVLAPSERKALIAGLKKLGLRAAESNS